MAVNKDLSFLSGGGEMGELMRSMDWSGTALGPLETWPQSLRTSVSLCLSSTFPILIAWGPETIQIYNDSYRPICGNLHPRSLGQNFRICWETALEVVGDAFTRGQQGEGTYIKDQRMFLDRNGYLEEAFMTFSFAPIRDESGQVGGIFHPITETTDKMLSGRRSQTIRDFSVLLNAAKSMEELGAVISSVYAQCSLDVPFFQLYQLMPEDGVNVKLLQSIGINNSKVVIDWPFAEAVRSRKLVTVTGLSGFESSMQPYPESPATAVIIPILIAGQELPYGFIIAGVSIRRALDEDYLHFYDLLGQSFNTAVANQLAYTQELQRSEALAAIDRAKTAFFSNVSHEFRTPLTLMLGPLETLLGEKDIQTSTYISEIHIVHRNAGRLLKLVNTLLDFSRLEAGRVSGRFYPVDLNTVTTDLASQFRTLIEKAGMSLLLQMNALDQPIYVDPEMWEKIVLNLLSNAFKFTLKGSITVKLEQTETHVQLQVIDTGTGIPAKELPLMFNRFHRIEASAGRTFEGSGIGLSLVKELVSLHKGTITVESTEGTGSCFTVLIPLGSAHLLPEQLVEDVAVHTQTLTLAFLQEADLFTRPQQDENIQENYVAGTKDFNVLIVDDNADMRAYLSRMLRPYYSLRTAIHGEHALKQIGESFPDLIISDIMMPVMDGKDLLQSLKINAATARIPFIFLSARAGEEARADGLEAGADDYLIKPFSAKELLTKVKTLLDKAVSQYKVEQTLKQHSEQLDAQIQLQDEFMSIASHELKTPLTNMKAYLQLLSRMLAGHDNITVINFLHKANLQSDKLARLVNELLDVTKIQAGKMVLHVSEFPVIELFDDFLQQHRESGSPHLIEVNGDPAAMLQGDQNRLEQVMSNLLNNAVKYSPRADRVILDIETINDIIILRVTDFGIGIPDDQLPFLFDRYFRVEETSNEFAGLGLGLYIAKEIIERHHGELTVTSEISKGTSFTVRLPLKTDPGIF